jgi:hypothetical protein
MGDLYAKVGFGAAILAASFVFSCAASAQNIASLESRLNQSDICKPLKFDVKDVAKALGIDLPHIPFGGDTTIGWDKNAHKAKSLVVDSNRNLTSDLELGCQPSSEATVLKVLKIKPDRLRLPENVTCTGTVESDGSVLDLICKPSGEMGKLLGSITNLNGQLQPIFKAVLAP